MRETEIADTCLSTEPCIIPTGINRALRQKGIKEGDTVVIGELELEWSDDQSEGAIYGRWLDDVKAEGKALRGSSRWPHAG